MKPHASCNDEALLKRVHGALSLGARLQQQLHLAGCPACRQRLREYGQLSGKLARGLAQAGQPPRLASAHSLLLPAPLWIVTGLVVAILGSLGTLAWQVRRSSPSASPASSLAAAATRELEDCPPPAGSPEADTLGNAPTPKQKKH